MAKKLPLETLDTSERIELFFHSTADYIYQNKSIFISLVVGFIIVAISVYGWSEFQNLQRIEQADALYETERSFEKFFENKDFEKGTAVMQKFVDQFPNSTYTPALLIRIGDTHSMMKQWDDAIQAYQQSQNLPQANEHTKKIALVSSVIAYIETKRFDQADQQIATLQNPKWNDAKLRLQATISLAQGNINDAKKKLEELTKTFPNSPLTSNARIILNTLNQ